jgi:hypothetical protein
MRQTRFNNNASYIIRTPAQETNKADICQSEGATQHFDDTRFEQLPPDIERTPEEQPQEEAQPPLNVRRSECQRRPPTHFQDYIPTNKIIMTATTAEQDTIEYEQCLWQEQPLLI